MLLIRVYYQSTRDTAWKVTSHDGFVWIGVIGIDLLRGVGVYPLPARGAHPHKIWGGELDCGDDFPKGVRATFCWVFFFWGGGTESLLPNFKGPNLTRRHHGKF